MKIIAGVLIAATLAFGSGCASTDWIDRTVVTVDVTGTWSGGSTGRDAGGNTILFELEQQGSTVKGFIRFAEGGGFFQQRRISPGPLEGTVAGDVFRFRQTNGTIAGELKVSGDEMAGLMSWQSSGPFLLRRVDSSSRPR